MSSDNATEVVVVHDVEYVEEEPVFVFKEPEVVKPKAPEAPKTVAPTPQPQPLRPRNVPRFSEVKR